MSAEMQQMLSFIRTEFGLSEESLRDVDTALVSSGLVDSLALVTVLVELEAITHRTIAAERVQPKDLETIRLMFSTAERLGVPTS